MNPKIIELQPNAANEMRTALLRWYRFSNEIMNSTMRLSQPILEAYFRGLSDVIPNLNDMVKKTCEIPETNCPPRCVCDMEWDACEGSKVSGTIDIVNSGDQAKSFTVSSGSFRTIDDDSGVKPQLKPDHFTLAPGDKQTVLVSVNIEKAFVQNDVYQTEVKIRGRYEQCVRLHLSVRRKYTPHCEIKHGEIPRRIVAHHWYDHFQCEELCFEPVRERVPTGSTKPKRTSQALKKKRSVKKKKSQRK